ncbi:MAG: cytidine deaminase [Prevotella sp.]|nr:cytidine deaminase [Prevotella sp.]
MKEIELKTTITAYQLEELTEAERHLVELAIEATSRSYAPYSRFHVGAALLLDNGVEIIGCNQENAAFPAGLCAERSAIFAAGAQYPNVPVKMIAIAARTPGGQLQATPVSPCGTCRQVLIETETRFRQPVRILLYGSECVYAVDSIKSLMPLSFTEFQ